MSPEQKLYTDLRMLCVELFGDKKVFDYLPPEGTEYPFVFIGEQFSNNERLHKHRLDKNSSVTIHFWHNDVYERGRLTKMMNDVEEAVINRYGAFGEVINTQVIDDNSTGVTLKHGILEVNIKYLRSDLHA